MKQKNVILMVVAVGCGLVAAFLTSQMSAKGQVEHVDVLVAAKDLPVGTILTKDDVEKGVIAKIRKMPKDGLPPAFVTDKEMLINKQLSRPVRIDETFNPQDLVKGGFVTLPPNHGMVSLPVGVGQAAAGFVGPGSRVDVLATIRLSNKLHSFPLLVNMLVVAVNTATTIDPATGGSFPNLSMVSFAVKEKEALVLSLAKTRGCNIELLLRHPETSDVNQKNDKLDDVIKLLTDDKEEVKVIANGNEGKRPEVDKEPVKPVTTVEPVKPETLVAPAPMFATVKVLVAKQEIAPNTSITKDLIAESFEWKELPKDYAADAMTDFTEALGKAFKTGVSKGQWVTWTMVGIQAPKAPPSEHFDPKTIPGAGDPVKPPEQPKPVKKNYHDVAVHTTSGTVIHRYEEVAPGKWKKVAELTPEQAEKSGLPEAPKANPEGKKVD
jgi:Flp pilus assembly protein CpaB